MFLLIGCPLNSTMKIKTAFIVQYPKLITQQLRKIDREINSICGDSEGYKLLLQIPDFGPIYTSIICA